MAETNSRDAVLFIPGLGDWLDQTAEGVAQRLAIAIDRNSKTAAAQFEIEVGGRDEDYQSSSGLDRKTRVRTIVRKDGDQKVPLIDLYKIEYGATLTKNYVEYSSTTKPKRQRKKSNCS
jgi:hypothetical protein